MTGTITNLNRDKGFAFARPDDGSEDVFVALKEVEDGNQRQQLAKNSRVEFEVGAAADGKKRPALNVRMITNSTPNGNATSPAAGPNANPQSATSTAKTAKYDPEKIGMKFLEVTLSGIYMLVKAWFNDSSLLLRAYLEGEDDGKQEAYADAEGYVDFTILVPKGWEENEFLQVCIVMVLDGNQATVPWRYNWRNPNKVAAEPAAEAKAAVATEKAELPDVIAARAAAEAKSVSEPPDPPPPPPPAPPKLEVKLRFRLGNTFNFRLKTGPERSVAVESACLIRIRKSGDPDWTADGRQHQIDSDEGGTLDLEVQLANSGDRGVVEFLANGLTRQEYLQNDDRPVYPAAKETL